VHSLFGLSQQVEVLALTRVIATSIERDGLLPDILGDLQSTRDPVLAVALMETLPNDSFPQSLFLREL
jgi:hypothetical protein